MHSIHQHIPQNGILSTIGKTPLVELKRLYPHSTSKIFAKIEAFNPGGSIKDRTAVGILKDAIQSGRLKPGNTVIESSSGNMAIGLAQACLFFNLPLIIVVDPNVNPQNVKILETYGAQIEQITERCPKGGYLNTRLKKVQELLKEIPNSFWTNQYSNPCNPKAHHHTMKEVLNSLQQPLDYLFVATSTCGTIMGCSDYLKATGQTTKLIAVDAVGSVLFDTPAQPRLIPGHGAGRPSQLLKKEAVCRPIHITDEECVIGCHRLLKREAILGGGSTGAIVMAVEKMLPSIPEGSTIAMIVADRGERYLETIYSKSWQTEHFGKDFTPFGDIKPTIIKKLVMNNLNDGVSKIKIVKESEVRTQHIAIVGGGPKGLYGLERLVAQLKENPVNTKVEIHLFNKSPHFGAGDIYNPNQPDFLKINYNVEHVNMWTTEQPSAVVDYTPDLITWMKSKYGSAKPMDYTARATVGKYLMEGLELILANLPNRVLVNQIVGTVVDISKAEKGYQITLKESGKDNPRILPLLFKNILLTTGHPRPKVQHPNHFKIPFVYPIENLNSVVSNAKVAIKGMGLTFVDTVLGLTEGRGGRFIRTAKGQLDYVPSKTEPRQIYPFSLSGAPMLPRLPYYTNDTTNLRFFTLENIQKYHPNPAEKIDFTTILLPLIKQEMTFSYYDAVFKENGFYDNFETLDYAQMRVCIALYHAQFPAAKKFQFEKFLFPFKNVEVTSPDDHHELILQYLQEGVNACKSGNKKNPLLTLTSVWRRITPVFRQYYEFGGLTPDSQRHFHEHYSGAFNRVTYGPPLESMEKILLLAKKGYVNFGFSQAKLIEKKGGKSLFQLASKVMNRTVCIDYLIDARIPKVNISENPDTLYANLLGKNLLQIFENRLGSAVYKAGCAAIDAQNGAALKPNGASNLGISLYGTPTEGATFDNDSLSRKCNNFASNWAKEVVEKLVINPQKDISFIEPKERAA